MFSSTRSSLLGSSLSIGCIGFALLGAVGCKETVASDHIRTAGISMATIVTAGSSSSHVEVTLTVGGNESNTYVVLKEGDTLIAVADDEDKTMERVADGVYEATFDTNAEDTEFTVRLEREDDDDAPGNTGTLPAPFMITSDFGSEEHSRAEDLEITWEDSGTDDDMELEVDDDNGETCIFSDSFDPSGDEGAYTLQGGELEGTSGDDETCDITLNLSRGREGVRDTALDNESTFWLYQVRSTTATSSP